MPVQWFMLRTIPPFPSVEYTGANADEVAEFAERFVGPGRTTFEDDELVVHMPDGDQVVKTGWLVCVLDGDLCVASDRIRDSWMEPSQPA